MVRLTAPSDTGHPHGSPAAQRRCWRPSQRSRSPRCSPRPPRPPAESAARRALAPAAPLRGRDAGGADDRPAGVPAHGAAPRRPDGRRTRRQPSRPPACCPSRARRSTMVTIRDPEALPAHEQSVADGLVAELEAQARRAQRSGYDGCAGLAHHERYPSMPQWLALRGSALALHSLHRPSQADRLARVRLRRLPAPAVRRRVGRRHAAHAARARARGRPHRAPPRVLRDADERRGAPAHGRCRRRPRDPPARAHRRAHAHRAARALGRGHADRRRRRRHGRRGRADRRGPRRRRADAHRPRPDGARRRDGRDARPARPACDCTRRWPAAARSPSSPPPAASTSSTSAARSTRCPTARPSSCCAARGARCAPAASSSRRACSTAARSRRCSTSVLHWPAVNQRSAAELARLIDAAGFPHRSGVARDPGDRAGLRDRDDRHRRLSARSRSIVARRMARRSSSPTAS